MNANILKRIQEIEQRIGNSLMPDLVMIFYSEYHNAWMVQESYMSDKGEPRNVERKFNSPDEYVLPDGFKGVCIIDDLCLPEGAESSFDKITQKHDSDDCRLIHIDYA